MWAYPVNLIEDSNREILVDFPDIPWCHTTGDDEAGALLNAVDALTVAFEALEDRREPIPLPSPAAPNQPVVVLPVILAAKATLYNALLEKNQRKADLARTLNVAPMRVDRLLSFRHKTRIEQIETALAALGRRLVVGISA